MSYKFAPDPLNEPDTVPVTVKLPEIVDLIDSTTKPSTGDTLAVTDPEEILAKFNPLIADADMSNKFAPDPLNEPEKRPLAEPVKLPVKEVAVITLAEIEDPDIIVPVKVSKRFKLPDRDVDPVTVKEPVIVTLPVCWVFETLPVGKSIYEAVSAKDALSASNAYDAVAVVPIR